MVIKSGRSTTPASAARSQELRIICKTPKLSVACSCVKAPTLCKLCTRLNAALKLSSSCFISRFSNMRKASMPELLGFESSLLTGSSGLVEALSLSTELPRKIPDTSSELPRKISSASSRLMSLFPRISASRL